VENAGAAWDALSCSRSERGRPVRSTGGRGDGKDDGDDEACPWAAGMFPSDGKRWPPPWSTVVGGRKRTRHRSEHASSGVSSTDDDAAAIDTRPAAFAAAVAALDAPGGSTVRTIVAVCGSIPSEEMPLSPCRTLPPPLPPLRRFSADNDDEASPCRVQAAHSSQASGHAAAKARPTASQAEGSAARDGRSRLGTKAAAAATTNKHNQTKNGA